MRAVYLVLASSVLLSACTDSPDEILGESEQGIVVRNRIASNRIASNRIASNRIASNRIASNRIASNRLTANEAALGDLLSTPGGIELFSFVVSCALPEGTTITAKDGTTPDPNDTIAFKGEVGLARDWASRPMSLRDQRWVSACMFARVNNNNVTVEISMRGPSPALDSTSAERAAWSVQEGAFYGNMFNSPSQPLLWYACRGRGQAAGETGGLNDRDCTEPDPARPGLTLCGFNYAGDCADFAPPANAYACKKEAFGTAGYYLGCATTATFGDDDGHGHGHGNGGWGRSNGHGHDDDEDDHNDGDCDHDDDNQAFHQVVTTYVLP